MPVIPLNDLNWSQTPITNHAVSAVEKLIAIKDIVDNDPNSKFETEDFCIEGVTKHNGGTNNSSGEGTLIIRSKPGTAIEDQRFVFGGAATMSSMANVGCPPHDENTLNQLHDQVFGGYAPKGFGNHANAIRPGGANLTSSDDAAWYTQDPSGDGSKPWTKYGLLTAQPGDQTWLIYSEDVLVVCHRKVSENKCSIWGAGRIIEAADSESGWTDWDAGLPGMFSSGGEANNSSYWVPADFWNKGWNTAPNFMNGANNNAELRKPLLMVLREDGVIFEKIRRIHNETELPQSGMGLLTTRSGKQVFLPVHLARAEGYYEYLGKLRNMCYANDAICRQQLHDNNDYLHAIFFSRSITGANDALAFVNPPPAP